MMLTEPAPETLATRAGNLFARFQTGDEATMGELVTLLTPILWHTVRSQNLDSVTSEDVLQNTWLALVRSADGITDARAVLQWLIVTAKREAWRVAKINRRIEPQDFEEDVVATDETAGPESIAVRNSANGRLWEHVKKLPERCRELLRVIAFADRPDYASVADALGMPIGSIGPTRGRCLAKLRAQLAADEQWEL